MRDRSSVASRIIGFILFFLQAVEDKYQMSLRAEHALEMQIMSLYDQIGRLTTPLPKHTAGAGRAAGYVLYRQIKHINKYEN